MLKKGVIAIAIAVFVFQIYSLIASKEKDTYADEQKAQVHEVKEEKPKHNVSDYVEGEKPLYIDGILVVNKDYGLPKDYAPESGREDTEAMKAFKEMKAAAKKDGIIINIRKE